MSLNEIASFFGSLYGIFLIVLFFGGSIFVHELGHFLAARKRGLKIERFSIGFGPRLFGWTGKDGVDYRISLLPLGGYVALPQMADMEAIEGKNEGDSEALPPISYTDKMIVAVAGVVFNIIFAFLLACILWIAKMPSGDAGTTVGYVAQYSDIENKTLTPAAAAGLQPGDTILSVNGSRVSDFTEVRTQIAGSAEKDENGKPRVILTVSRAGKTLEIVASPERRSPYPGSTAGWLQLDIEPAQDMIIAQPMKNSPAAKAGLTQGEKIIAVDGKRVYTTLQLSELLKAQSGKQIALTTENPGAIPPAERTVRLTPVPIKRSVETATLLFTENGKTRTLNFVPAPENLRTKDPAAPRTALTAFSFLPVDSEIGQKIGVGSIITGVNLPKAIVAVHSPKDLAEAVAEAGDSAEFFVSNGASVEKITLKNPKAKVEPPEMRPSIGVGNAVKRPLVRKNPVEQLGKVFEDTFSTLGKLLNPKSEIGVKHLMGVVGMAEVYYSAADDLRRVIWFTIVININLAILNILPIPVLDGGHMVIATIQRLAGRRFPLKILVGVQYLFIGLLFAFMGYVILNDLERCSSTKTLEKQNLLVTKYCLVAPDFTEPAPK